MRGLRVSLIAASLGLAALASSPARADLIIGAGTNFGTSCPALNPNCYFASGNSTLTGSGTFNDGAGNVWSYTVTLLGNGGAVFPDIFNINNLDMSGTGSLTLFATETNLNYGSAVNLLQEFDSLNVTNVNETRSLWIDKTNGGNTSILLGCVSNDGAIINGTTCNADGNSTITKLSKLITGLSGNFSLTEEIQVSSTVNGSNTLQTEDEVFLVPEPVSLSLFGTGLVALGAFGRRKRKSAKSA